VNRKGPKAGRTCFEKEVLQRLAISLADNGPLIALYEDYKRELEAATARYFGKTQLAKKAVLNLLVAVASRARTCDLQTMQTKQRLLQCADIEARRLREALDAAVVRSLAARSVR
jgi:hypothetical protein